MPVGRKVGIGVEDGNPGLVPVPGRTGVAGVLGEEHRAARRAGIAHQKLAALAGFEGHVIGMHGEIGLVAPRHKVGTLIFQLISVNSKITRTMPA